MGLFSAELPARCKAKSICAADGAVINCGLHARRLFGTADATERISDALRRLLA